MISAKRRALIIGISPNGGGFALAPYYLKAYADENPTVRENCDVQVLQFFLEHSSKQIAREILQEGCEFVGFSCYAWNILKFLEIATLIKHSKPNIKIIAGGPEASSCDDDFVLQNKCIDVFVQGEGEATFAELLAKYLENHSIDFNGVAGIVFRGKNGLVRTLARPLIKNLDDIPSPILKGLIPFVPNEEASFPYESYRGCPYSCGFCAWGPLGTVRYFSDGRVESELKCLLEAGVRHIWFFDAIANLNKQRLKRILRVLTRHQTENSSFGFELYGDLLDEETIELLASLKSADLQFGLQTINPETLKLANRRFDREKFGRNITLLLAKAPKKTVVAVDVICGLPGDTYRDFENSVKFVMSLFVEKIVVNCLSILPGSAYRRNANALGIEFEKNPPYRALRTSTFSPQDFQKGYKMTEIINTSWARGALRKIYELSQATGENPFDLMMEAEHYVSRRLFGKYSDFFFPPIKMCYPGDRPNRFIYRPETGNVFVRRYVPFKIVSTLINPIMKWLLFLFIEKKRASRFQNDHAHPNPRLVRA